MSGADRLLWITVVVLVVAGIVALPSFGWLLILIALGIALGGAARRGRALLARIGAGVLGIVVAYLLLAPGMCAGSSLGTEECASFIGIPLGGENYLPFAIVAPFAAAGLAAAVRRPPSAG